MRSVSWKNAVHVVVLLCQDCIPDRALYTRPSALIRGESARPRDHCYPDVLRGSGKTRRAKNLLFTYEKGRDGGEGGVCRVDSTAWYPRAIHRNSATRLSDPHDLTYTEDATVLQR